MRYEDKKENYYSGGRPTLVKYVPENTKSLLDIGCGRGGSLFLVKQKNKDIETWGVELMELQAKEAIKIADKVLIGSIEENIKYLPDNYFDVITMFDVLEHLSYPEDILRSLKKKLKDSGMIISSIPNVRYCTNLRDLFLFKDWKYVEAGILDYTHLRFFTKKSILRLYKNSGYKVYLHKGINAVKLWKFFLINILSLGILNDSKYLQFLTIAKKE